MMIMMSSIDYSDSDSDSELIKINEWMNKGVGWMVSGVLGGSTQQKRSDPIFDRWMQVWYSFQKSIATYRLHQRWRWLRTISRRSLLFPTSSLSSSTNEWMNGIVEWLINEWIIMMIGWWKRVCCISSPMIGLASSKITKKRSLRCYCH